MRVQITESAEAADFAVVDDVDSRAKPALARPIPPRMPVAISATPPSGAPVIYLSQDGPADYRIFVRSKTFSAREAAALVVGADGGIIRIDAASL